MQYPYATFFDAEGEDFVPVQYRAWKAVNDQCLQMIAQGIDSPELLSLQLQLHNLNIRGIRIRHSYFPEVPPELPVPFHLRLHEA